MPDDYDDDTVVFAPDADDVKKTVFSLIHEYSAQRDEKTKIAGSELHGIPDDILRQFRDMFRDMGNAGGDATMEATKQALDDVSKTERQRLDIARLYTSELRAQNRQMTEQNQQLAASINGRNGNRTAEEMLQQTIDSNVRKRNDAREEDTMQPIPVVVRNTDDMVHMAATQPAPQRQGAAARPEPVVRRQERPVSGQVRSRTTNVSSPLDTYEEVLGKLGFNNILASSRKFDGVLERFRRTSEALERIGDQISPSKASISLAQSGQRQPSGPSVAAQETETARERIPQSPTVMSRTASSDAGVGAITDNQVQNAAKAATRLAQGLDVGSNVAEAGTAATGASEALSGATADGSSLLSRIAGTVGGGLSRAAGFLGSVASNPFVAAGTAVLGAVKAGRDEMFNARRMGSLQGGSAGEGLQMQGQDRFQDVRNFLGISNVSGNDLDRYRTLASQSGFDIDSQSGRDIIDLQTYAKEQGLDSTTAEKYTQSIIAFGGSTDEAKESLDQLRETAKNTGQDFNTLANSMTKAQGAIDRYATGDTSQNRRTATRTETQLRDELRNIKPNANAEDVQSIMQNPAFRSMLAASAPRSDLPQLLTPESSYAYANTHPEAAMRALQGVLSLDQNTWRSNYNNFRRMGQNERQATDNATSLTQAYNQGIGLGNLAPNGERLQQQLRGSDYQSPYGRLDIRVSTDEGLNAKVRRQNSLEDAYNGLAPYTSVNNRKE